MTSRLLLWSARRSSTRGGLSALAATTVLAAGLATLPVACSAGPAGPDAGRPDSVTPAAGDEDPRPSVPADDHGRDVGSASGLPSLFPAAEGSVSLGEPVTLSDGSTARLRGRARPEEAAGDVRLVLDRGARRLEAPVPAGWTPTLLTQPVTGHRRSQGGAGLVVSQEGGDSDTWTVYVRDAGRLVPVTVEGRIRLGGGFTADGAHARLSWLTPRGEMFTRVGLDREHHFRVYAWTLSGTRLRAHDLGEVCLDLQAQPPDYGRC